MVHTMYTDIQRDINEYNRTTYTRYKLGSHRLKVKTGRWSRIPRQNRLCNWQYSEIQDERHIVETCAHMNEPRLNYTLDYNLVNFHKNNSATATATPPSTKTIVSTKP